MIELVGGVAGRAIGQAVEQAVGAGSSVQGASAGQAAGPSFSDVLQSLGTGVIDNLKGAEAQSFAAVKGEADTRQVVDALMSAEQSLQTAIAIRDKLVTAYLEVSRMQI
ncbi:flagellar hook-basal body complex protein FliE [Pseudohoeflea suaedae]|uniref:Flagellar hook-basal body complex protein FliE n=1 Tax=Pseudohoeflea suaedae TaxID=877384 RepID=A0A4R5PMN0_9HYPH|nr:flagellar hook-basal body complex protein FliE [Pseudohoeflea suaedae]TDH38262.1 flagellar hook-basal body complex protein FliE [Pseudohoeflea suaedae]